jgi:hypothetical protein
MLKFQQGNAKLTEKVNTFSLPAGYTCPYAKECKTKVVVIGDKKKIQDSKDCRFRCFAAVSEALFPNVYNARHHNLTLLKQAKTTKKMAALIQSSLAKPKKAERIHVSGDFFNQSYFNAWMNVAKNNPDRCFYAYTKSLPYWIKYLESNGSLPNNFVLNASFGGKHDDLIEQHNLKSVKVVFSEDEAKKLGLEIDHDDSHAMKDGPSFALLLHGIQPKNSKAALAKKALKGKGGYSWK